MPSSVIGQKQKFPCLMSLVANVLSGAVYPRLIDSKLRGYDGPSQASERVRQRQS